MAESLRVSIVVSVLWLGSVAHRELPRVGSQDGRGATQRVSQCAVLHLSLLRMARDLQWEKNTETSDMPQVRRLAEQRVADGCKLFGRDAYRG